MEYQSTFNPGICWIMCGVAICCVFPPQVVWMKNGREVKMGKKYEYVITDRKRILMVHNVTEEDVGIYDCVLSDDKMSLQLALKGILIKNPPSPISSFTQSQQNNLSAIKLFENVLQLLFCGTMLG